MIDENKTPNETSEGQIAEELHALGVHLREILRSAWESPERKKVHQEIQNGLADLGETINSAANEFSQSPTGQTLKADVEDIKQRIQTGEVENKVREEILKALRMVNTELEKVSQKETETAGDDIPQQDEEA